MAGRDRIEIEQGGLTARCGTDLGDTPEIVNDPRRTAVREAGHAVIGRMLGIGMGQASMAPDDYTGRDVMEEPRDTLMRWRMYGRPNRDFRSVFRARFSAGGGRRGRARHPRRAAGGRRLARR